MGETVSETQRRLISRGRGGGERDFNKRGQLDAASQDLRQQTDCRRSLKVPGEKWPPPPPPLGKENKRGEETARQAKGGWPHCLEWVIEYT